MNFLKFLFLILFITSCKKVDINRISTSTWNPQLALPIAYGSFTISDILNQADSLVDFIDPVKRPLLQLKINESIKGFSVSDAIKLPDFNTLPEQSVYKFSDLNPNDLLQINELAKGSLNLRFPFLKIIKRYDPNLQLNQSIDLNFSKGSDLPSEFSIKKIKFSKGKLKVNVKYSIPHQTILKFTFNEIKKNNSKLVDSLVYKTNSNSMEIDLTGYEADFSLNKLTFSIDDIIIIPTAKDIVSSDKIVLGVEMVDVNFESIEGYFGQLKIPPISDTLKIDQLKDLKGTFGITNPSIKLSVTSGFGIPVELGFENFSVIKKDNSKLNLFVNTPLSIYGPENINAPDSTSIIVLNSSTVSNFDKLLNSDTKEIQIGGNLYVNKGSNSSTKNFIKNTSKISLNAEVTVPLTGYANDFKFSDTTDFTLPSDVLKSLEINLNYRNTLPLDIDADITFLDKFNKPIKKDGKDFNLITSSSQKLIKSPFLKYDNDSKSYKLFESDLNNVQYENIIISLKESDLPYLKNAVKVVFSGSFDTFKHPDNVAANLNTPITLYDYYGLSIKLFAKAKGKLPSNLK